jgi:Mg-chelatase subunit ChlD
MEKLRMRYQHSHDLLQGETLTRFIFRLARHSIVPACLLVFVATATAQNTKRGSARKPPADEAPKVMSSEKFLETYLPSFAPKKESRSYRTGSNNRTKFFGTEAQGDTIVFVIDNSTSMHEGGRLDRAHRELIKSVSTMRWPQKFHVIAFDSQTLEMPGGPYISAGSDGSRHVRSWLQRLNQGDDTRPGPALKLALGLKPDCIFFLTDGEFTNPSPDTIRGWNTGDVPVHVIDLNPQAKFTPLERIAADSGGTYRHP